MDKEQENLENDVLQLELALKKPDTANAEENEEDDIAENGIAGCSDGEIGLEIAEAMADDPLQTALTLNKAYQELLTQHIATIKQLILNNKQRQTLAVDDVRKQVENTRVSQGELELFQWPYFKDKEGFGPTRNKDGQLRDACFVELEPPKIWSIQQEKIMLNSLTKQMKLKTLKHLLLRLRKIREGKTADPDFTEKELEEQLQFTREDFSLADLPEDDIIASADWLQISNHDLKGEHAVEDCIAMFRSVCNPAINRTRWTGAEDKKLAELVHENSHLDWEYIAEQLGTGRSPYLCIQRYQSELNNVPSAEWTQERLTILKNSVEHLRGLRDKTSWFEVARCVDVMTPRECRQKYDEIQRVEPWTDQEDKRLIAAVVKHGQSDWYKVSLSVLSRDCGGCRTRWLQVLSTADITHWTQDDDHIMYKFILEHRKTCDENNIDHRDTRYTLKSLKDLWPRRAPNSITQRLKILARQIDKGMINDTTFLKDLTVKEERILDGESEEEMVDGETGVKKSKGKLYDPSWYYQNRQPKQTNRIATATRNSETDQYIRSKTLERQLLIHPTARAICGQHLSTREKERLDNLLETLEPTMRILLNDETITLSKEEVRSCMRQLNKSIDKERKQVAILTRPVCPGKDLATIRKRIGKSFGSTNVKNEMASNCERSTEFDPMIVSYFADQNRAERADEFIQLEQQFKQMVEDRKPTEDEKTTMLNILPPTFSTVSALAGYRKMERYLKSISNRFIPTLSLTHLEDQQFHDRMMSIFTWPVALEKIRPFKRLQKERRPPAPPPQPKQYNIPLYEVPVEQFTSGSLPSHVVDNTVNKISNSAVNMSTVTPSNEITSVYEPNIEQENQSVAKEQPNNAAPSSEPIHLKLRNARSGRTVPTDVAAIILRELQKKNGKPDEEDEVIQSSAVESEADEEGIHMIVNQSKFETPTEKLKKKHKEMTPGIDYDTLVIEVVQPKLSKKKKKAAITTPTNRLLGPVQEPPTIQLDLTKPVEPQPKIVDRKRKIDEHENVCNEKQVSAPKALWDVTLGSIVSSADENRKKNAELKDMVIPTDSNQPQTGSSSSVQITPVVSRVAKNDHTEGQPAEDQVEILPEETKEEKLQRLAMEKLKNQFPGSIPCAFGKDERWVIDPVTGEIKPVESSHEIQTEDNKFVKSAAELKKAKEKAEPRVKHRRKSATTDNQSLIKNETSEVLVKPKTATKRAPRRKKSDSETLSSSIEVKKTTTKTGTKPPAVRKDDMKKEKISTKKRVKFDKNTMEPAANPQQTSVGKDKSSPQKTVKKRQPIIVTEPGPTLEQSEQDVAKEAAKRSPSQRKSAKAAAERQVVGEEFDVLDDSDADEDYHPEEIKPKRSRRG